MITSRSAAELPLATGAARLFRLALLYVADMAIVVGLFVLYFLGRGLPSDRINLSTRNAGHIIDIERSLGIFWEPAWQDVALRHERLIDVANFTYLQLHMPLLVVVGFAFFCADARKHRVIRNAILISAFLALPIYAAFPVTPPRLLTLAGQEFGFTDTLAGLRPSKPGAISNWYAAMPSYHFGWIALATAGAWWCWKNVLVRLAAVLFAGLMWWAIVVTGNHYFLDMVAGAAMVALSALLALRWEEFARTHERAVSRFTVTISGRRFPF